MCHIIFCHIYTNIYICDNICIYTFEYEISSIVSFVWMIGTQLEALFGKIIEYIKGRPLMEEVMSLGQALSSITWPYFLFSYFLWADEMWSPFFLPDCLLLHAFAIVMDCNLSGTLSLINPFSPLSCCLPAYPIIATEKKLIRMLCRKIELSYFTIFTKFSFFLSPWIYQAKTNISRRNNVRFLTPVEVTAP